MTAATANEKPPQQVDNSLSSSIPDSNSTESHDDAAQHDASDPGPPPDGGFQAWSQTVVAHLVMFNSWGYINSFGFFQSYYVSALGVSPSAISWVGSVQIFLIFFVGTFSGRATDAGHYRKVIVAGLFLQLLGVFMTSLSTKYWQLFLAQGICTGLGDGLTFCPTIALLATYFVKRRSMAIAINASGAGSGGIFFPLIAQQLLPKIGFGWTVRVMGFVMLFNTVIILALARTRLPPRKLGPIVEWSSFKELPYALFCVGMFLSFWAIFFAFYYVPTYGRTVIGVSSTTSLTLLLVMNAVGIPARILLAVLSDKFIGPMRTLILTTFFSGLLLYCWVSVNSEGRLFAFCIIYGSFAGGVQSVFPAACSGLTTDLKKMGMRTGMVFTVVSVACLTGPPLAGALIERGNGDFLYAQVFGGSALMGGTLVLLAVAISNGAISLPHLHK
ncbi:MFS monocarboxylate transporter [Colletotrichum chrysophilum]|uniref:MFS monocarboxylate transporter n=1 Tax=Colletotrichum chrysophilum TaxID=1836956 RepID=A0AAD9EPR4_9PEZI|nr:MFS monocarboxylate transporter [Colletotrichum chrysophilum]